MGNRRYDRHNSLCLLLTCDGLSRVRFPAQVQNILVMKRKRIKQGRGYLKLGQCSAFECACDDMRDRTDVHFLPSYQAHHDVRLLSKYPETIIPFDRAFFDSDGNPLY